MRFIVFAGAAFFALAACDAPPPAAPVDEVAQPLDADIPAPALPTARSCEDIAALAAAFNEPIPFATLRTGKFKLDGRELDDKFTTSVAPAGATCEIGLMDGFGPNPGKIHVVNCSLFSSGLLDREENALKAKAVFDAASSDLSRCLPSDWTSRTGASKDPNANEAMIYETRADAERAMTASYYTYPIELRKEWSEGTSFGGPAGWRVYLNFQKESSAPATPAAPQ